MLNFSTVAGVISDMDGVLWRGDVALPGMAEFFDLLHSHQIPYVLATNNSSKSQAAYVAKLEKLGIAGVAEAHIITSAIATGSYLQEGYPPGTTVHVLGGDGLRQAMTDAGFTLTDDNAQVVAVGADFTLTYEKLKRAALLIRAGADFIGSNADATFPMPDGLAPGAGSLIAALETATDRKATIIGKPHAPMFEAAVRLLNTPREQTLMIGDRMNTDVAGAQKVGLKTALVLSGVATREQALSSPQPPDGIYDDLAALVKDWRETSTRPT
jgi:4-nitrophenyl phosphatase